MCQAFEMDISILPILLPFHALSIAVLIEDVDVLVQVWTNWVSTDDVNICVIECIICFLNVCLHPVFGE